MALRSAVLAFFMPLAQAQRAYPSFPPVDYSDILTPLSYCNESYSFERARVLQSGLSGRSLRVSVGAGTVTSALLNPDNFMRIVPGSPDIAHWNELECCGCTTRTSLVS